MEKQATTDNVFKGLVLGLLFSLNVAMFMLWHQQKTIKRQQDRQIENLNNQTVWTAQKMEDVHKKMFPEKHRQMNITVYKKPEPARPAIAEKPKK